MELKKSENCVFLDQKADKKTGKNKLPFRFIFSITIVFIKCVLIVGLGVLLLIVFPPFRWVEFMFRIVLAVKIIVSADNPDYKLPWLLFLLILPVAGITSYFLFYSKSLNIKYVKNLNYLNGKSYRKSDEKEFIELKKQDAFAYSQAKLLTQISNCNLFFSGDITYLNSGEKTFDEMLCDLSNAKKFIFLQYFIIKSGTLWQKIKSLLIKKAMSGVEVKLLFDDVGCMKSASTLGVSDLVNHGVQVATFSKINAFSGREFNNRNHRKITVIDGEVAYIGGVNVADEYINAVNRFGHWKDCGVRIKGSAVKEITKLFLTDYYLSTRKIDEFIDNRYPTLVAKESAEYGFCIPFGDGPRPIYPHSVTKTAILNLIGYATNYLYITTPYLVMDDELCLALESASLKNVDVRIILPSIPDKRIVFEVSKSYYPRLIQKGVKIYEYKKGFVHSKIYLADRKCAIVGSANLDYRSLVHHFEVGAWLYGTACLKDIENDLTNLMESCELVNGKRLNQNSFTKGLISVVKIFSPLL